MTKEVIKLEKQREKVELAPYDDLFSTEESRQDAKLEKIQEIPLSELHPFKGHPFKVKDDEAMMETADSVRQYGVLVPAIARPDPEGGYEWLPVTGGTGPVSWPRKKPCLSLSETWTMMLPLSSWWTATYNVKACSPAKGPLLTR